MGILDKLKQHRDDENSTVTGLQDKAASGMDQAGQMIDDKTGNKFSGQVDTGVEKAKQMMGQDTPDGGQADGSSGEVSPTDDTQEQPPTS